MKCTVEDLRVDERIKNGRPGQRGFTLLELIFVLFLAGTVIGLSTIVMLGRALPSAKLNATAREISATLREARMLASVTGERQTVAVNLDYRTYGITGRKTKSIPRDTGIIVRDPFIGDVRNGVYLFTSGGNEGGSIVLWSGRKSAVIRTDPVIGAVTIVTGSAT